MIRFEDSRQSCRVTHIEGASGPCSRGGSNTRQPCPSPCRVVLALARRAALGTLVCCFGFALAAKAASAQSGPILVVGVSEVGSGSPIADAEVYLPELGRRTRTDRLGEARLSG